LQTVITKFTVKENYPADKIINMLNALVMLSIISIYLFTVQANSLLPLVNARSGRLCGDQ